MAAVIPISSNRLDAAATAAPAKAAQVDNKWVGGTLKIEGAENLKKLLVIIRVWKEKASAIAAQLKSQKDLSDEQKIVRGDSAEIIEKLECNCSSEQPKDSVSPDVDCPMWYVAYDQAKRVQAIAQVYSPQSFEGIARGKCYWLSNLATNPDNIAPMGGKIAVKGSGTAVLIRVVQDILLQKDSEQADLSLNTTTSAKPFYTKLGFTKTGSDDNEYVWPPGFTLPVKEMVSFVLRHAHRSVKVFDAADFQTFSA